MKTLSLLTFLAVLALPVISVAENDCTLGARYVDSARQRAAASDNDEAQKLLQQAVEACPSYDAYQMLGDLQAQSAQRSEQAQAVESFVAAAGMAPSPKARAHTLYTYARLLERDGDPQNAYPLIRDAQTLDPASAQIAQLSSQIEQQVNNPTGANLTRGLWGSLYKPLRVSAAVRSSEQREPEAGSAGPSINIPINFETGSVVVDEQTRANVVILAHALADPNHSDQHYLFVGHADIRGSEPANVVLSKRRAQAIYSAIVRVTPSLLGRVEVSGRGSSEPIDPAHNERAYRANRRLQVLLQ